MRLNRLGVNMLVQAEEHCLEQMTWIQTPALRPTQSMALGKSLNSIGLRLLYYTLGLRITMRI